MTSDSESNASDKTSPPVESRGELLKLGAVAVASALLGGMAAAWWYRKTIERLHETGENSINPHFGIDSDHPTDDTAEDFL
ncbi:MAG: hypothetical protein WAL75_13325 [Terracidiphilus sp.]